MPKRTLSEKMDDVMANHLPHLDKRLSVLESKVTWWAIGLLIAIIVTAFVPDTAKLWGAILGR